MPRPPRIGIFGGTFDPPHVGHLVAAVNVAFQLELDEVQFVVANVPWQKVGERHISEPEHRVALVELAVADAAKLRVSTREIARGGDSVTADTLQELHRELPDTQLHLVLGSDAAAGLGTWRRFEEVARLARLAIVERPGAAGERPPALFSWDVVACPLVDLSSTAIRDRCTAGLPIDYLVPNAVRDYIADHGLYR